MFERAPIFAAALLAAATSASAEGAGFNRWIDAYDADNDGSVTIGELRRGRASQFDRMDRNGDDALSQSEISQILQRLKRRSPDRLAGFERAIAGADSNRDGVITKDEYISATPIFARADANGDAVVTRAELARLEQDLR